MVNDPIADFIIRLKNAGMVGHKTVSVPFSQFKMAVAEALLKAGYVSSVEKTGKKIRKTIVVELAYKTNGNTRISSVKRVSKPGRRLYKSAKEIFPVRYGKGSLVISTPNGIMTDSEARDAHVGGEVLFEIY